MGDVFSDCFVVDFGFFFAVGEEESGFVGFVVKKKSSTASEVSFLSVVFLNNNMSKVDAGGEVSVVFVNAKFSFFGSELQSFGIAVKEGFVRCSNSEFKHVYLVLCRSITSSIDAAM